MKHSSSALLFLLFFFQVVKAQVVDTAQSDDRNITILFAGDVMGHMPQVHAAYDSFTGTYNFSPCFQFVKPYVEKADIAIANLETTLAGEPYSGYPLFSTPDAMAQALVNTGFDILATANNHCLDKGRKGLERTIAIIDSLKVFRMGTYLNEKDKKEKYPLVIDFKGIRIALFNYTYGTNGISVDYPNVVNYINRNIIEKDIAKADSLGADIKIAFLHWGLEYELNPNENQKSLARYLASKGMNAIVGSHPHVVQTFEVIRDSINRKSVPVFYSLGNFISNQRDRYRDGGTMCLFKINFSNIKDSIKVETYYIPYWVYKGRLNQKVNYYVIPVHDFIEQKISITLPEEDKEKLNDFQSIIEKQLNNLVPYKL